MSAIIWPAELEHPEPNGYSWQRVDTTSRVPMGEGFVRNRPRGTPGAAPAGLTCSWILPSEQEQLLDDLYSVVLRNGSDTLLMPVWTAGAFHAKNVLMKGPPKFSYVSREMTAAQAEFVVQDSMSNSLWVDFSVDADNRNEVVTLKAFAAGTYRLPRVDVFVREACNSGTADLVTVGWSDDSDAILDDVVVTATGHFPITTQGAGAGGVDLGDLIVAGGVKTLIAQWASTGTAPTTGDFVLVVPYRSF